MKKSYTISDFYEFYLSYIERETVYDVDYKTYRQIVEDYFKYIVEEIMEIVENSNYHVDLEI